MKLNLSSKLILFGILLLAAIFRLYGLNWDQGYHLHPDERAIIMTVTKLQFPDNLTSFLSKDSPWNPHFFAYGSFPFYLLKFLGNLLGVFNPLFYSYGLITIVGRFLSGVFDLATLIVLFYIAKKLYGHAVGYIAALLYGLSVLPIQLSHFFAVDSMLTFFTLIVLYISILFYEKPTLKRSLLIGVFFGLALATKVSAIVLIVSIGSALIADFVLLFLKQPHKPHIWYPQMPAFIKHVLLYASIILATTFIVFAICSPYTLIDFPEFWRQTLEQSQMTHNAFTFPYTLQYVGKTPYLYEIKNIFLWGLGPFLGSLAFVGIIYFIHQVFTKKKHTKRGHEIIIGIFFITYFWITGDFVIGFMRYMLPLYPLLCLFAALTAYKFLKFLQTNIKNSFLLGAFIIILYSLILVWPLSFMHIYTLPNTRTTATHWINEFVPRGKVLAQEHWDDPVPLEGGEKYRFVTLPLYDPDTPEKWQNMKKLLAQTDYIIIASNRLYTPLQKLTDCKSLPPGRCYTRTAEYYHALFSGALGFQKIAEFTSYPTIPIFNIPINDQGADESFTVYDHPKIMIFQKINPSL